MKLSIIPVTPFAQNCSLVVCEATGQAALIDPGGDVDRLVAAVGKSGARLAKILVTHGTGFNWFEPDHFRVVALPEEDILTEAIGRIAEYLETIRQD